MRTCRSIARGKNDHSQNLIDFVLKFLVAHFIFYFPLAVFFLSFLSFVSAMAQVAYEDTYLTILDVDGEEAADQLRARMYDPNESLPSTEQSWLLVNSTYHQSFT